MDYRIPIIPRQTSELCTFAKRERGLRKHFQATNHLNFACNHQAGLGFEIILPLLCSAGEGQIPKCYFAILALITIGTHLASQLEGRARARPLGWQRVEHDNLFTHGYTPCFHALHFYREHVAIFFTKSKIIHETSLRTKEFGTNRDKV